jgi:hypothetical protein
LVYWKLNWDTNDSSWNNRTWTSNNITYESNGTIQVAKFVSWSYVYRDDSVFDIYGTQNYTYSIWVKPTQLPASYRNSFWICESNDYSTQDKAIDIYPDWHASWYIWQNAEKRANSNAWAIEVNKRYNLITTFDWTTLKLFINWVLVWSVATTSSYNFSNPRLILSRYTSDISYFVWYVSNFIFENIAWTDDYCWEYFSTYKYFYWLN